MCNWTIANGHVLRPEGLTSEHLNISNGILTDAPSAGSEHYNADGCYVLPGIIDLHGDGFEKVFEPRPGVSFPLKGALHEADRQMIMNGITTGFHGLTVSWEPGLRSPENAAEFVETLQEVTPELLVDTHINFRWEVYALDAVAQVMGWLTKMPQSILSINDHLTANLALDKHSAKVGRFATRVGMTPDEAFDFMKKIAKRAIEVPVAIQKICDHARANNTIIFAHDEVTPNERQSNRELGMTVSEFPMSMETAKSTVTAGEVSILGAPNVVRGKSHNNALDATQAIKSQACSALASDYYYPSQRLAAFKLFEESGLDLQTAWALISKTPAQAANLLDRGELKTGLRADIVIVDIETKRVKAVFVGGKRVLSIG